MRAHFPEPTRQLLRQLSYEMPPITGFVMRASTAKAIGWMFRPLVKAQLSKHPATNAIIRTTTAPTVFHAGEQENSIPSQARAVINFRILPGESIDDVLRHVRKKIRDDDIEINVVGVPSEPSPISSTDSDAYKTLAQLSIELYPDAVVAPSLFVAATDSRHYAGIAENIYKFTPIRLNDQEMSRIHGTDERISLQNYANLVRFHRALIERMARPR